MPGEAVSILDASTFIDVILLALMLLAAFAIIFIRHLFSVVMVSGVYSLLSAAVFLNLDAVDVAFTEAAVGAGVSTVLMLAAMLLTEREARPVPISKQIGPLIIVVIAGLAMFAAIGDMPAYGDPDSPANAYLREIYVGDTYKDIHIPNVVTAVLASYRGYDTFGEAVVIFCAGLGVLLLLGLNGNAGKWRAQPNGVRISQPAAPAARKQDVPETKAPAKKKRKTKAGGKS